MSFLPSVTSTTLLDWITALGTLSAVAVALGLGVGPAFARRINRPKLQFAFGEAEPHIRLLREKSGFGVIGVLVRVEVQNVGKTEALCVRAVLTRWWARTENERAYDWVEHDIDPMVLRWVTTPNVETKVGEVSIASHRSNFLEVARFDTYSGKSYLSPLNEQQANSPLKEGWALFDLESHYPNSEHRVEIVVSADNAPILRGVVSYTASKHMFATTVANSSEPKGVVQRTGYLNIIREFRGRISEDEENPDGSD